MSLRLRLGLSFALVAVTTALVVVLATPVVIRYGFEPVLPTPTTMPAGPASSDDASSPAAGDPPGATGDAAGGPDGSMSPGGDGGPDVPSNRATSSPPPTAPTSTLPPTPRPTSPGSSTASPLQSGRPTASPGQDGGPAATGGPAAPGGPSATHTPKPNPSHGGSGQDGSPEPVGRRGGPPEQVGTAALAAAQAAGSARSPADAAPSPPPAASGSPSPDPAALAWVEVERRTSNILVLVAVLSAVVAIALGLILAEALIRPLQRLGRAASAIAGGDLSRRSGVAGRRDEIGDLGRSFDTMAAALQRADESRRHFLQDAAHELGTPVTAIQTTASAILDGVYEPERRHLETIRDEARLLARIVDDLRTIALAEVRQLPLAVEDVDLVAITRSTADAFSAAAAARGCRVTVRGAGPVVARGDPDRIRQVLAALVDNALRYVPDGGEVRVVTMVAGDRVEALVEDDGPGLGDHPERVFDRFYRADATPDRAAGHAGLGLAIVRALVEAQAGSVSATNHPAGGASFRIELPGRAAPGSAGEDMPAGMQPGQA